MDVNQGYCASIGYSFIGIQTINIQRIYVCVHLTKSFLWNEMAQNGIGSSKCKRGTVLCIPTEYILALSIGLVLLIPRITYAIDVR